MDRQDINIADPAYQAYLAAQGQDPTNMEGIDRPDALDTDAEIIRLRNQIMHLHNDFETQKRQIEQLATPNSTNSGPSNEQPAYDNLRVLPSLNLDGMKIQPPWTYDGEIENNACKLWCDAMRDYLQFYSTRGVFQNEGEKIVMAATYLRANAKRLWNARRIRNDRLPVDHVERIQNLEQFFDALKHSCADINQQERVRMHYQTLVQTRDVRRYAYDLFELVHQLEPEPPSYEIKEKFKLGLKSHVHDELVRIFDPPEQLDAFIALCEKIDRNHFEKSKIRRGYEQYNRMSLHSIQEPSGSSRASSSKSAKPEKGTPQWQSWCKDHKACFECGSTSHPVRDCTLRSRSRSHSVAGRSGSRDRSRDRSRDHSRTRSTSRSGPRKGFGHNKRGKSPHPRTQVRDPSQGNRRFIPGKGRAY